MKAVVEEHEVIEMPYNTPPRSIALWALGEWMKAPHETTVIVASPKKGYAYGNVWGHIESCFLDTPGFPGESVDSINGGRIYYIDEDGEKCMSGLYLVQFDDGGIENILGVKNHRVIFIADGMSEMRDEMDDLYFQNIRCNPYSRYVIVR